MPVDDAVTRERRWLAAQLHDGVVQQVTALSLAVDSALLHHADAGSAGLESALRSIRAIADATVGDCRALIDALQAPADP